MLGIRQPLGFLEICDTSRFVQPLFIYFSINICNNTPELHKEKKLIRIEHSAIIYKDGFSNLLPWLEYKNQKLIKNPMSQLIISTLSQLDMYSPKLASV